MPPRHPGPYPRAYRPERLLVVALLIGASLLEVGQVLQARKMRRLVETACPPAAVDGAWPRAGADPIGDKIAEIRAASEPRW